MYGSYGKPLHQQPARHRSRRGGVATAQFRDALTAGSGGQVPKHQRPLEVRRRAYRKLIARRAWSPTARSLRVLIVGTLVAVGGMIGHAAWVTDDLVSYDERPNEYASLVALVAAECEADVCVVPRRSIRSQSPEVSRLMHRLRVQAVRHDRALGRTTLRGGYRAPYRLEYVSPPTPQQMRWRAIEADRVAAQRWGRPPDIQNLGGGWVRVFAR